ncbi:hypothetical protein MMC12_001862 [Toensbergia leucococca]|nr:hypothetical protein [Toensbergia leucococca]
MWRGGDNGKKEEEQSIDHMDILSLDDCGYKGRICELEKGISEPVTEASPSKHVLRKAASKTFQAFSDTIRSKAQAFYTSPDRQGASTHDTTGQSTPKRSGQRHTIWSSMRTHGGKSGQLAHRLENQSPSTPSRAPSKSTDTSSSLDQIILGSPLLKPLANDKSIPELSYSITEHLKMLQPSSELGQLWLNSPPTTSSQFFQYDGSNMDIPMAVDLEDPYIDPPSGSSKVERGLPNASSASYSEDGGYTTDIESNTENSASDGLSLAHTVSYLASKPSRSETTRSSISSSSLCVNLSRSNTRVRRSTSSSRVITQITECSPATIKPGTPELLNIVTDKEEQPETPTRPFSGCTSSSNQVPNTLRPSSTLLKRSEPVVRINQSRFPSDVYEADIESGSPSPDVPNMGSRPAWNQVRADRDERYLAIDTMSQETYSDEGLEPGLELVRTVWLTPTGNSLLSQVEEAKKDQSAYGPGENCSPLSCNKDQSDGIEDLRTVTAATVEPPESLNPWVSPPAKRNVSPCPQGSLHYAVEAIERIGGTMLDEAPDETTIHSVETSNPNSSPDRYLSPQNFRDSHKRGRGSPGMSKNIKEWMRLSSPEIADFSDSTSLPQNPLPLTNEEPKISSPAVTPEHTLLLPSKLTHGGISNASEWHVRSSPTDSVPTPNSCAITTHSKFGGVSTMLQPIHVRSSPVRSTSSILVEIEEMGLKGKDNVGSQDIPGSLSVGTRLQNAFDGAKQGIDRGITTVERITTAAENKVVGKRLPKRFTREFRAQRAVDLQDPRQHTRLESDDQDRTFNAAKLPYFNSLSRSKTALGKQATALPERRVRFSPKKPILIGSTRSKHERKRFWKMRDISVGSSGDFTYDAVGSPKTEWQVSSAETGVQWTESTLLPIPTNTDDGNVIFSQDLVDIARAALEQMKINERNDHVGSESEQSQWEDLSSDDEYFLGLKGFVDDL